MSQARRSHTDRATRRGEITAGARPEEFTIDEEIEALIPRLSPEELAQLDHNILAEGCRDKLVVWDDGRHRRLLDGHNRLTICKRHGLNYEIDVVVLPNREAAILWVLKHQLGRRNLSPEAMSYLRGRLYNGAKRQGARYLRRSVRRPDIRPGRKRALGGSWAECPHSRDTARDHPPRHQAGFAVVPIFVG